jgi:hypothetical protein
MIASIVHNIFVDHACDTGMQTSCCRHLSWVETKEVSVACDSDRPYHRHFESLENLFCAFPHFCLPVCLGLKAEA